MGAFFILFIFFGIASIMIGPAQFVFQVWAHFSFHKAQNQEINTGVRKRYNLFADNSHVQETFIWRRVFTTWTVICKICDIFNYSWKRKRTRNFVTNCDWKKCFSIRKFEQKFTLMAFTQEIERGINFGLLKRVNGTHSLSILNNGQGTFSLTGRRFYM